jgi:hypothetical protein
MNRERLVDPKADGRRAQSRRAKGEGVQDRIEIEEFTAEVAPPL